MGRAESPKTKTKLPLSLEWSVTVDRQHTLIDVQGARLMGKHAFVVIKAVVLNSICC